MDMQLDNTRDAICRGAKLSKLKRDNIRAKQQQTIDDFIA